MLITSLKKALYFPIASYFRFFAGIRLTRWKPKIVVVTGSNGKTTLLHLLESQLGKSAKYSHHANSSFGIPFDILGLHRKSLLKTEWVSLFLKAPLNAFLYPFKEKIYIVEADCDRPGEGKFISSLLNPEVVLWVSVSKTHSMNFDRLVQQGKFNSVEEAVAYEFGYFLEYCTKTAIINGDLPLEVKQAERTRAKVMSINKKEQLDSYELQKDRTVYKIKGEKFSLKALLPEDIFYAIAMCKSLIEYLEIPFDKNFSKFILPPGRSSIFKGIKDTTIIDSCYNANLASMNAILKMFGEYPADKKWAVVGDMLEQGQGVTQEHERLAGLLSEYNFERIILMGPRVAEFTYPKLKELKNDKIIFEKFIGPRETLDYILKNLRGGETILFKGARFMEGIIENLLLDKKDVSKLARREEIWEKRRKSFGL